MIQPISVSATKPFSSISMGKYRIAACPRRLPDGRFAAQVSIASGQGSASTDRVMRFLDDFATPEAAAHYAVSQGIAWVKAMLAQRGPLAEPPMALPKTSVICH